MEYLKTIAYGDTAMSIKRIEFLLEEILIQVVAARSNDLEKEEGTNKIKAVLNHVNDSMRIFIENLPSPNGEPN